MKPSQTFPGLPELAAHLRQELEDKKFVLLYGYNGTGKTCLSMAFKDIGKKGEARDTLYFNAFTEDLFTWDNDLEGDSDRKLRINSASRFFSGLAHLEMDNRIRPLLQRYADFDFRIDTDEWVVLFSRTVGDQTFDNIKVSRGEENIFIWCFFLAIVRLAMDGAEAYICIDDPISSLDEHNAIAVGNHLVQFLARKDHSIKTVISSHHTLFFNVLWNEIRLIDRRSSLLTSCRTPEQQVSITSPILETHLSFIIWRCWRKFAALRKLGKCTRTTSMPCAVFSKNHRFFMGTRTFPSASRNK